MSFFSGLNLSNPNPTLHLGVMSSPESPSVWNSSSVFVFNDHDTCEEHWPVILYNVLQLGVYLMLPHESAYSFWQEHYRSDVMPFLVHRLRGFDVSSH